MTKVNYYSSLALFIQPTKYQYAQGIEIYSKKGKGKWYYEDTLNPKKHDGLYLYRLKKNTKYSIKIRTYKVVNGKKVYSSWSSVKTVTR